MRLETTLIRGPQVAKDWGSEPNLRSELKWSITVTLAAMLRTNDLIDFVVTTKDDGDTVITASLEASSTGDEHRAAFPETHSS